MNILIQLCTVVIIGITVMSLPYSASNALDEVRQHPKSKLVAVGVEVTFHCQLADHLNPYWVVDDTPGIPVYLNSLRNMGFFIGNSSQNGTTTLSLRVTATMDKNGTEISCSSTDQLRTDKAVLLVIQDSPISPNPSTENTNATSILLKWSPPFLWPGYSIDYYNISVMNNSHLINATFNNALVIFMIYAEESSIESCHMLEICLSAVSSDAQYLTTFNVNGGFVPTPLDSDLKDLNITILFRSDRTPLVTIDIHLSERICSYQDINFTFIIDANSENESALGPYQQTGSDPFSKTFMSEFEKDRDYNLTVIFDTVAGRIISDTYYFNTTLQYQMYPCRNQQEKNVSVYKLVMIVSLSVVALMLLIFALLTFRVTVVWIRERHGKRVIETARRFQNVMVQNPIYEGPLYETLDTQLSNLNHTLSAATKSISPDHTTNTASMEIVNSSPTLRYVEQPCLPQNISPMEGHSTSAQCHALKQDNGLVIKLTVPTSTHGYGEQVHGNDTD